MSLEQAIMDLTIAVNALSQQSAAPAPAAKVAKPPVEKEEKEKEEEAPKAKAKRAPRKKAAAKEEPAPKAAPKKRAAKKKPVEEEEDTDGDFEFLDPDVDDIDAAAIRELCQYITGNNPDQRKPIKDLFTEYGGSKVADIDEGEYPDLYAELVGLSA